MAERVARLWLLSIAVGVAASALPARAEPLTRAAAIRMAMAQNPQVAAARAREAGAEARARQVDAAGYPEVTVSVGVGPGLKATLVDGTAARSEEDAYDFELADVSVVVGSQLEVLQPLYTFGKLGRRDDATRHDRRAREAQTRMTRLEVALEAARLYEGLLFAQDAALFFEDVERQLGDTIESTVERIEDGEPDVSEAELLQLKSARSFALLQLHRANASVRQARGGLRAYLGLSPEAPLELASDRLATLGSEPGQLEQRVREAAANRPELRALSEGASAMRALSAAREADALPDLFALGFLSGAYTPGRDLVRSRYIVDPQQHLVPGLIVGVRWAWQAGRGDARASERRAQAAELEGMLRWAQAGIPAEVRRAYEDAARARLDIAEADKAVKVAKRWVVMATADYTVGLVGSSAVVDAFEAYAGLRVSFMDAQYRFNVAMAELAAATGTLDAEPGALYPGPPAADAGDDDDAH